MGKEVPQWRIVPGHSWGPVELGMSREEAKSAIQRGGGELEDDDEEDLSYLGTETPWGEFQFESRDRKLAKITVLDGSLLFGDEPLEEPTLDTAITAIGAKSFNDTRWTHGELKQPLPDDADTQLLRSGVLWLVSLGVGLELYRGKVEAVFLCRPGEAPSSLLGPLTPAQLELATNPDLFCDNPALPMPRSPRHLWLLRLTVLVALLLMGLQVYRAYLAEIRWSGAVPIMGEVVETLPVGDNFPDLYVVRYEPTGVVAQQVTIKSQFIGGLLPIGKKVEIRYLPERPAEATTIWEAREHGFVDFIPSILGIAAIFLGVYAALLVVLS